MEFLQVEKGSVESTHKVQYSTDQPLPVPHETQPGAAVVPLGGLTHRRGIQGSGPTPRPSHTTSIGPHAGSSYDWGLPVPPSKYDLSPVPGPWGT